MMWTTLQRSKLTGSISGWVGGEGPTLVLIHGVGMNADFWSNLLPHLQTRFRVIAIDMPGHGQSARLGERKATIATYTDLLARALVAEKERMFIIGHSMGAMICLDLAHRYAAKVAGIAALNGVFERTPDASVAVKNRVSELDRAAESKEQSAPPIYMTLSRWFGEEPREEVEQQAANMCREWLTGVDLEGYRQAYRAFAWSDGPTRDQLSELKCPALYLTGEHEPNSTPAMSAAMAQLTPNGVVGIVPNAKHMMPMTHGELVCQQLVRFMEKIGFSSSF